MSKIDCAQFLLLALLLIVYVVLALRQARLRREIALAEQRHAEETERLRGSLRELQTQLEETQQDLRSVREQTEETLRLARAQQQSEPVEEPWEMLIQRALSGDENSVLRLRQRIMQDGNVHIVDFADQYRHLNDHLYAEFSDRGSGGCLLIPADAAPGQYLAYPLPTGGDWFSRHRELLLTVFNAPTDSLHGSAVMGVKKPATLRVKASGGQKLTIYELVEKGTLGC